MSLFAGPEYESYVALMRKLRLERAPLQPGDWFAWDEHPSVAVLCVRPMPRNLDNYAWLPRLDQWLAMLEEAGVEYVDVGVAWVAPEGVLAERAEAGEATKTYYAYDASNHPDTDEKTEFPSREEACARLWLAVTGRAAPTTSAGAVLP